jgi:TonB family protein
VVTSAAGESTAASFKTDWSTATAVQTDAPEPETALSETTLTLTASEVAALAATDVPAPEFNTVETAPAHAEAERPTATVAESKSAESAHDVTRVETTRSEIASSLQAEIARTAAARIGAAATDPAPARVKETPAVSAQQSKAQWMGLAAAAVIAVAVMGVPLGVWLGTRHQTQPEPPQPAAPRVQKPAVAAAPVPAAAAPVKNSEVPAPKPQVVADAQPKAAAPVLPAAKASKPAAKTARKSDAAARPSALQSVSVPVVQGLAALPASAVGEPQPVAEPPRSVAPIAPVGRLFEPADVDESPRVASRVEPQVPDDVMKRFPKDVVVVRVLVSQTGHPFRVSLLRRSLGGPSLDNAVVSAVSQWTFSPARKRGEAVSCWMNFGVPIGR